MSNSAATVTMAKNITFSLFGIPKWFHVYIFVDDLNFFAFDFLSFAFFQFVSKSPAIKEKDGSQIDVLLQSNDQLKCWRLNSSSLNELQMTFSLSIVFYSLFFDRVSHISSLLLFFSPLGGTRAFLREFRQNKQPKYKRKKIVDKKKDKKHRRKLTARRFSQHTHPPRIFVDKGNFNRA